MRVPKRTQIAQAVNWVSGMLSYIRTPQRTYEWVGEIPDTKWKFDGWMWMSCATAYRVMEWSVRIDPKHWDHWAVEHDRCKPVRCAVCGGLVCGYPDEEED